MAAEISLAEKQVGLGYLGPGVVGKQRYRRVVNFRDQCVSVAWHKMSVPDVDLVGVSLAQERPWKQSRHGGNGATLLPKSRSETFAVLWSFLLTKNSRTLSRTVRALGEMYTP